LIPPLITLFRDIQNRVQNLHVGQPHIAALRREAIFDAGILLFGVDAAYKPHNVHARKIRIFRLELRRELFTGIFR
jgi:hypothetical protein